MVQELTAISTKTLASPEVERYMLLIEKFTNSINPILTLSSDMLPGKRKIKTLEIDKVAWLLGTDNMTVQKWADAGILKSYPTNHRTKKIFRRKDVAVLLAKLGA